MNGDSLRQIVLEFDQLFEENPDQGIPLIVYAFCSSGKLLAAAGLDGGKARLKIPAVSAARARLFFAPKSPEPKQRDLLQRESFTLADMERLRAYQPPWHYSLSEELYKFKPIPKEVWKWWLYCRCRVPGRVTKNVLIAGVPTPMPVCDARVHICEVDPLWLILRRIPDAGVFRLRDEFLRLVHEPPLPEPPELITPWPTPPGPWPGPMVEFSGGENPTLGLSWNWFNPQPEPPARLVSTVNPPALPTLASSLNQLSPQPEPPDLPAERIQAELINLPLQSQLALGSKSPTILRKALIEHADLLRPVLCHFPWLYPFLRCDEVAVIDTDTDGRFEADIWYRCSGDHPDLYFWVEYFLGGSWQTVYRPTLRCHVWWNYPCGTEVQIGITDARVPTCGGGPDLPGLQVVVAAIGNHVSMAEILHPVAGPPGGDWLLASDTGMTTSTESRIAGYVPGGPIPFAGSLELRLDMSRTNLIAAGITHYRWLYRRVRKGDGTADVDSLHPMTRSVFRHYKVQVPDPASPGGFRPDYPAAQLGMDPAFPGHYLTRIQPELTPAGDHEWRSLNEHVDLAWAYFDTADLIEPATEGTATPLPKVGKYELLLELFNVSSGVPELVRWDEPAGPGSTPIAIFVASNTAPFGPPEGMHTHPAPEVLVKKDGVGHIVGFRMMVHVDNSRCVAAIDDVVLQTPGEPDVLAGPCGFLRFPDRHVSKALVGFWARHPHDHADFYFRIDKGSAGPVGPACAGWLPAAVPGDPDRGFVRWTAVGTAVNGFSRSSTSHFSKQVSVATLLDSHGHCDAAAFGETMYVAARATNGYQRAAWLDASATPKAFALSPLSP
jgi:hypothetical protein